MSKREYKNEPAGHAPAVVVKRERLGVFMRAWNVVTSYGQNSLNSHIKSYRPLQLVFKDSEIDELLAKGAPLRVYYHDVEPTASGTNVRTER